MKAFFGMTAAVLLVVVALTAGKVTAAEIQGADGEKKDQSIAAKGSKKKEPKCKEGAKTRKEKILKNCKMRCEHGNLIKECQRWITWKICLGGNWKNQYIIGIDRKRIGKCDCEIPLFAYTTGRTAIDGECGMCKHCENFQCVPNPCKPSPSSPDDCPCPPAK